MLEAIIRPPLINSTISQYKQCFAYRSNSLLAPYCDKTAQYITLARRVAAAVFERASPHPFVKHARRAQKFSEEHQLAMGRGM